MESYTGDSWLCQPHNPYCRQEVIHELRVDFYTEEEYDPMPEQILNVLEDAGIAVPEQTIVYDTNTRRICYSMKCEMAG